MIMPFDFSAARCECSSIPHQIYFQCLYRSEIILPKNLLYPEGVISSLIMPPVLILRWIAFFWGRGVMSVNSLYKPVTLICLLAVLLSSCEKITTGEPGRGDMFPRSALSELMSDAVNQPKLEGKTLVVNFWATWCPPCRKEMPELQRLSDAMDKNRFMVIGVSVDEDKNLMREFLLQQKILFVNYHDVEQHLARDLLKVRAYPETFIISPQGIIIRRIVGAQSWNSKAVHSLLESVHKGEGLEKSGGLSG